MHKTILRMILVFVLPLTVCVNTAVGEKSAETSILERVRKMFGGKAEGEFVERSRKRFGGKTEAKPPKGPHAVVTWNNKVTFLDAEGRTVKEIPLNMETVIEEEDAEYREEGAWEMKTKKVKYMKEIDKGAVVSEGGKFTLVGTNKTYVGTVTDEGKKERFFEPGGGTGKFAFLNGAGEVLWKKELPTGRRALFPPATLAPLISDNGETVVVLTHGTGESWNADGRDILYVYDKTGKEITAIPTAEEFTNEEITNPHPGCLSPNGRYLEIFAEKNYKGRSIFYDLKTGAFWDARKSYWVYFITNDGVTKVGGMSAKDPRIMINLKEKFSKP